MNESLLIKIEDVTGSAWDIESVFIEKVISALPDNFDFNGILEDCDSPKYKIWKRCCGDVLSEFISGEYVYFEALGHKKIMISSYDIDTLKEKLRHNESTIILRTRNIVLNEAIHADDELWDER